MSNTERNLLLAVFIILLGGCGDGPPAPRPTDAVQEAKEPAKLVEKMSGRIELTGISTEGLTYMEVIVVSELDALTRERLKTQRHFFEARIRGVDLADLQKSREISPEDAQKLGAKIETLQASFPKVIRAELEIDNRRQRFSSDLEMQKEYAKLFDAIRIDNLDRAVRFLQEKVKSDNNRLLSNAEQASDARHAQMSLDNQWLEQVAAYLKKYLALYRELAAAKQAYARTIAATPEAEMSWEAYSAAYSPSLIVDIFKNSPAATELAGDGSFEVKGHGDLILRLEYSPLSMFFLLGDEDETRVVLHDLKKFAE